MISLFVGRGFVGRGFVALRRLALVGLAVATVGATQVVANEADTSAYRLYVKTQADTLVGMTRLLAREIKDGNLEAAQAAYAPAHRYYTRIETIARIAHFDARLDERGPVTFSGFHRIEYGLFAKRSTADLLDIAERLDKDARELRERVTRLDPAPSILMEQAARLAADLAETAAVGEAERYARSDLWDVEAGVEGIHEIVALAQIEAGAQGAAPFTRVGVHFDAIAAQLAKHKDGCGFKNFDELSAADKAALRTPVAALAAALGTLRTASATD